MNKKCNICKEIKPVIEFWKHSYHSDGYSSSCKKCNNTKRKESGKNKKQSRRYYNENKERRRADSLIYYYKNINECRKKNNNWYLTNKEKKKEYNKIYRENNKEKWSHRTSEEFRKNAKNWPSYINVNTKYKNNIIFKLISIFRTRIKAALKNNQKKGKAIELLGCSVDEFKNHLQQTAIDNGYSEFNIENYSGKEYHIDHIIPCSAFNIKCSYHQKLCFNWSNMQILESQTNMSKHNKIAA